MNEEVANGLLVVPECPKDRLKLSEQLTGLSAKSINPQQEQVKQWTLALK